MTPLQRLVAVLRLVTFVYIACETHAQETGDCPIICSLSLRCINSSMSSPLSFAILNGTIGAETRMHLTRSPPCSHRLATRDGNATRCSNSWSIGPRLRNVSMGWESQRTAVWQQGSVRVMWLWESNNIGWHIRIHFQQIDGHLLFRLLYWQPLRRWSKAGAGNQRSHRWDRS